MISAAALYMLVPLFILSLASDPVIEAHTIVLKDHIHLSLINFFNINWTYNTARSLARYPHKLSSPSVFSTIITATIAQLTHGLD